MKQIKGIWFPDSDTHYQKMQFDTAMKYIKPEDRWVFIDVGAHVGLWLRMAQKAGFKEFLCFEPNEENFDCLRRNFYEFFQEYRSCSLSDHSYKYDSDAIKRRLRCYGLSDKEEELFIKKSKEDNSGSSEISEDGNLIKLYPFDKFLKNRIPDLLEEYEEHISCVDFFLPLNPKKCLIKIDVQGYEAKVVRGMTNFIKEYKPIIIVEQWLNGKEDLEATHYCQSLGMKILERVGKEVILGW
jgi:FkbM family methyltransferase